MTLSLQSWKAGVERKLKPLLKIVSWAAGALFAIPIALALALWLLPLERIAETQLREWLRKHDIPLHFTLSALDMRHIVIDEVYFEDSDDAGIDRITLTYHPLNLLIGQLGTLSANGLDITLRQQEDGSVSLTPAAPLLAFFSGEESSPKDTPAPALPFDRLVLEDVLLTYVPLEGEPWKAVLSTDIARDLSGSVHVLGARMPLDAESRIELTDILLERQEPALPFTFSIARIAHHTPQKAYFTPMHALGEIRATKENRQFDGMIVISDLLDRWVLNLKGQADMQEKTWDVSIDQPPVFFESGILQPDQLFPFLRGMVKNATGNFSVNGFARKTIDKEEAESGGNFSFRDISLEVKGTPIRQVNGTIAFDSLFPLATQGEQSVTVEEIILGLPLRGGNLRFTLDRNGKVALAPSTWRWAGGKLSSSAATMDIRTLDIGYLELTAHDLSVEQLLSNLLPQGFSATGQLHGKLPLTFQNGAALIRKGQLSTPGGGVLRYIPPDEGAPLQKGQSFQTDLLLSALEDFHYDTLSLDLNSKDERILELGLRLRGRNPQLYNGQIIELNINLTGNLLEAIQGTLSIYSLSERLEEQFSR